MKTNRLFTATATALALIACSCTSGSKLAGFWNGHDITVTESNYSEVQDRFAAFAELLVQAQPADASAALDEFINKLTADDVSYYVFSEWMVSAFHSLLSPCRNASLFSKCVERFSTDGIMSENEYVPLLDLSAKDMLNHKGRECTLPELLDENGSPVTLNPGEETLFLVVNLDCATCVSALNALSDKPGRHIALCFGNTPAPAAEGWEYCYPKDIDEYFDLDAAPFWFMAGPDGRVSVPYSPAPEYKGLFATPDKQ